MPKSKPKVERSHSFMFDFQLIGKVANTEPRTPAIQNGYVSSRLWGIRKWPSNLERSEPFIACLPFFLSSSLPPVFLSNACFEKELIQRFPAQEFKTHSTVNSACTSLSSQSAGFCERHERTEERAHWGSVAIVRCCYS